MALGLAVLYLNVKHDIGTFEIPVDDVLRVEEVKPGEDRGGNGGDLLLGPGRADLR